MRVHTFVQAFVKGGAWVIWSPHDLKHFGSLKYKLSLICIGSILMVRKKTDNKLLKIYLFLKFIYYYLFLLIFYIDYRINKQKCAFLEIHPSVFTFLNIHYYGMKILSVYLNIPFFLYNRSYFYNIQSLFLWLEMRKLMLDIEKKNIINKIISLLTY